MTWCHPSVEVSEPQVNEKRPIYTSSWIPEENLFAGTELTSGGNCPDYEKAFSGPRVNRR